MRSDRELASKLRTSGKSYKQIRAELGVPIATLSDWFSKHAWSKQIADKLKIAARERNIARIRYLGKKCQNSGLFVALSGLK